MPVNERIRPAGEQPGATAGGKATHTDWSAEVELLQLRLRDLRRSAAPAARQPASREEADRPGAGPAGMGKSLLESLAYAQTVQPRQERPRKTVRRNWRAEAFETPLGSDLLPDSGWTNKRERGDN
ncbi:hypothetical protein ACFFNY_26690 [Paenibacillus hodogayensis]|uniref:Uncharacterized protein n=1 Tax=Paenibacillus hodogayensis TaxID=279208 RepID=A0ABV5W3N9_9BACL